MNDRKLIERSIGMYVYMVHGPHHVREEHNGTLILDSLLHRRCGLRKYDIIWISLGLLNVAHSLLSPNHSFYLVLKSLGVTEILKVLLKRCVLHSKVHTSQILQRLPICTLFSRLID